MKVKEYHLYLYAPTFDFVTDLTVEQVKNSIEKEVNIYTYQVITCTTDLFNHGYRIFVHESSDSEYEITFGKCDRTTREIKMGHCLYKMILSGEFDKIKE